MPSVNDLQRELGELRRHLVDLQRESRANANTLASAIRKTRNQLDTNELQSAVRRGRPSTAAQLWDPRGGEFSQPDLETSLISRLRRGDTLSNRIGDNPSKQFGAMMLRDGGWYSHGRKNPIPVTTFAPLAGEEWQFAYVLNVSTAPTTRDARLVLYEGDDRLAAKGNLLGVHLDGWPSSGTSDITVFIRTVNPLPYDDIDTVGGPTWLVGAVSLYPYIALGTNDWAFLEAVINVEFVNAAGTVYPSAGALFYWTVFLDNAGAVPDLNPRTIRAAIDTAGLAPGDQIYMQLRIHAYELHSDAEFSDIDVFFGEPRLALMNVESDPTWSTLVAHYGTTFPTSPITNDRFYRTDLDLEFIYGGGKWVSVNTFTATAPWVAALAATQNTHDPWLPMPFGGTYEVLSDSISIMFRVAGGGTALGASHKWRIQVNDTASDQQLAGYEIASGASTGADRMSGNIVSGVVSPVTKTHFYVFVTKTGTPGDLSFVLQYVYRLIAT